MTRCLAILAEPDPALCQLLARLLPKAQWEVEVCSSASQLRAELRALLVSRSEGVLLVTNARLASLCIEDIVEFGRARRDLGLSSMRVLFTCELGDLEQPLPALGPAELIGILEKPFDIETFEALVRSSLPICRDTRPALDSFPG